MKRIAETRQRVKEIWEVKSRNTSGQEAHRDVEEHAQSEQVMQRQLLQQARDERRRNVAQSRISVEQQRRQEVRRCPAAAVGRDQVGIALPLTPQPIVWLRRRLL
jgi:hypothetical protein